MPEVTSLCIFSPYEVDCCRMSEKATWKEGEKKKSRKTPPLANMSTPCMRASVGAIPRVSWARLSPVAILNRAGVTCMNGTDIYGTTEALFKFQSKKKGKVTLISEKFITDHLARVWWAYKLHIFYITWYICPAGLFKTSFLLIWTWMLLSHDWLTVGLEALMLLKKKKKTYPGFTLFNFTAVQITFNSEGLSGLSHT